MAKALGEPDTRRGATVATSRRKLLYWGLGAVATASAAVLVTRFVFDRAGDGPQQTNLVQEGWRFCEKCQSLFFDGFPAKGVCAAGGAHAAQGFNFVLPHTAGHRGQPDWRFCGKCQSLFFDGYPAKGVCAAGGTHVPQGFNFVLPHDVGSAGQAAWRFCQRCQTLFFDGYPAKGVCAAGDTHIAAGYNFILPHI